MVDAIDSKSIVLRDMLVRARPGAPKNSLKLLKYMSKKIILALFTVLSLAACENKKEEKVNDTEQSTNTETTSEHHKKTTEENKKDAHSSEAAKPAEESSAKPAEESSAKPAEEHKPE